MADKQFNVLWGEALHSASRSEYVADHAADDAPGTIWDVAHMSVLQMRDHAGLSRAAFSRRYCIPIRTLEEWDAERRTAPDYVRLLIALDMGLIRRDA